MRHFLFCLLPCAALFTACQPVTPASRNTISPSPELTANDATLLLSSPQVTHTPVAPSVQPETLSSGKVNKSNDQTEIDLAISNLTTGIGTKNIWSQASSNTTPQVVAIPKTFDPKKIIGFATPMLFRDLGKANMVRKEGLIEVWQYQFASCVIDFFFYPIVNDTSQLIAKSWDMRSAVMGDSLDHDGCRAEMDTYHRKITSSS